MNDDAQLKQKYGSRAKRIRLALDDLKGASSLSVIKTLPYLKVHELTENRKHQISINAGHPYRLILVPADNPPALKPDGGIDWENVRAVQIPGVVDYH
jgi:proteic killer suppression protein